jgi:hypothetical protein
MRYKVTVVRPVVYFVDAPSREWAETSALQHASYGTRPSYTLDPHAEAEREYGEMTVEEATEEKHAVRP